MIEWMGTKRNKIFERRREEVPYFLLSRTYITLRIDYGDGRVTRGSSTKMLISQLWIVIFRHAIHH